MLPARLIDTFLWSTNRQTSTSRTDVASCNEIDAASTVKQSRWRTKRGISGEFLARERAKRIFVLGALTIHSSLREG
jgi:hypothetical protein